MIRRLPEEATYFDIHGRVVQAEVEFDATQFADRETRLKAAHEYLELLNQAAEEITAWEEDVHSKIEQVQVGPRISLPNPDCEYWRLLRRAIASNIKLKDTRDKFKDRLKAYEQKENAKGTGA